jgi:hypothetical protein
MSSGSRYHHRRMNARASSGIVSLRVGKMG